MDDELHTLRPATTTTLDRPMSEQLELDLFQTHDAERDFRAWLLSFPPTPWWTEPGTTPKPSHRAEKPNLRRRHRRVLQAKIHGSP
jgi:hypothetical protein